MEIKDVVNAVAAVFNVTPQQILEGGEDMGARDVAIYLTRKHLDSCFLLELEQAFHADRETIIKKSFSRNLRGLRNINFAEELTFADEEVRRLKCGERKYPSETKAEVCQLQCEERKYSAEANNEVG